MWRCGAKWTFRQRAWPQSHPKGCDGGPAVAGTSAKAGVRCRPRPDRARPTEGPAPGCVRPCGTSRRRGLGRNTGLLRRRWPDGHQQGRSSVARLRAVPVCQIRVTRTLGWRCGAAFRQFVSWLLGERFGVQEPPGRNTQPVASMGLSGCRNVPNSGQRCGDPVAALHKMLQTGNWREEHKYLKFQLN